MSDNEQEEQQPTTSKRALALSLQKWNLYHLIKLIDGESNSVKFAEDNGLLPTSKICPTHKIQMSINSDGGLGYFRCRRGTCRGENRASRAKGTWFENSKLSVQEVIYLTYCFAKRSPYEEVQHQDFSGSGTIFSTRTIADWYSYCREVIVADFSNHRENGPMIGGVGRIVQIDESKFGKRKYNKGRRVDGHWVLGMIEDGSEDLRLEICDDIVRSAEILIPLIKKHVLPGTTIHTDYWKAYDCLPAHGYIHRKVNHSDPDNPFVAADGTHTQRIESQWRVVKRCFYNSNSSHNFGDWILEYQRRRNMKKNGQHPFEELLSAIRRQYGDFRR